MNLELPAFTPSLPVKAQINIGALFDIPTGEFLQGEYGEYILNGGLSYITGVTAIGNMFKSTTMHYMSFSALSRIDESVGGTYDTEFNTNPSHLEDLARNIPGLENVDILNDGRWILTDKTIYPGEKWYEIHKAFCENKIKTFEKIKVKTPFIGRDNKPLYIALPSFTEVDSFSEFETSDVTKMLNENELGDSGTNTIHLRQGLAKQRFLMEAPRLNGGSSNYLLMTAQLGKESTMQQSGGGREVPITKNKYLKNGDAVKQVTGKFLSLTHNCWHIYDSRPLMQADGNGPLYPRYAEDDLKYDTDLNTIHIRNLRGKFGSSGIPLVMVVSQSEGILPSLTEFHYIKELDRYGLEGNMQNYSLAIYPDVKLSRTTVRGKINTDPKLCRALNITAEMCQIQQLWHNLESFMRITPKELFDKITAAGYDWDMILSQTRGWWTVNNDSNEHKLRFLSVMDLFNMANGTYHPYWLEDDKKTIKKQFAYKG